MNIYELLRADNTIVVNRTLAHRIGINVAIVFSALLSKWHYYHTNDMMQDDYFYSTHEDLTESTSLTRRQQDTAIDKLVELGWIEVVVMGMPAKRNFKITANERDILDILTVAPIGQTSCTKPPNKMHETAKQDARNRKTSMAERDKLVARNRQQNYSNKTVVNETFKKVSKSASASGNKPTEPKQKSFNEIIDEEVTDKQVNAAMREFVRMRLAKKGRPFTNYALGLRIAELNKLTTVPAEQVAIINYTITKGYDQFYDQRVTANDRAPGVMSSFDTDEFYEAALKHSMGLIEADNPAEGIAANA